MDGQTLVNLEIFSNNVDGSLSGKRAHLFPSFACINFFFPSVANVFCLGANFQYFLLLSLWNLCFIISGTLYKHLDHCITSSGKRLLRRWICHPLKDINEINDRLNAVEGLIKQSGVVSIIAEYLRRLPDLERLLGRVKATVGSSSTLLPFVGEKILKQRVLQITFYSYNFLFTHTTSPTHHAC